MKLWVKFLIGTALGILCAFILPVGTTRVLTLCAEWTVRLGRYTVIPLVFSSAFIAIYRLREERSYLRTGAWIAGTVAGSAVLLTLVALGSSLLVSLPRLPVTGVESVATAAAVPNIAELLFPSSAFNALCNGDCAVAAFLVGAFAGGAAAGDKGVCKPLVTVFDSLSVLCYNVSTLFYEVLPIGGIALSWKWVLEYRSMIRALQCLPLAALLLADLGFVALVLYPLLLVILTGERRPYRVLYAALAPLIAAGLSCDANFCLPLLTRMGSEDFGIRRRVNATVCPIFVSFARGGASVVSIVCFVAVWHSYSSLPIPMNDLLHLCALSCALSFALAATPQGGTFIMFTMVCATYGRGFETGSAMLLPAAVFLSSVAAMFDVLTCAFGQVLIASRTNMIKPRSVRDFI